MSLREQAALNRVTQLAVLLWRDFVSTALFLFNIQANLKAFYPSLEDFWRTGMIMQNLRHGGRGRGFPQLR